jgi:hypothetical protein
MKNGGRERTRTRAHRTRKRGQYRDETGNPMICERSARATRRQRFDARDM